jgi:hypothetical protein
MDLATRGVVSHGKNCRNFKEQVLLLVKVNSDHSLLLSMQKMMMKKKKKKKKAFFHDSFLLAMLSVSANSRNLKMDQILYFILFHIHLLAVRNEEAEEENNLIRVQSTQILHPTFLMSK